MTILRNCESIELSQTGRKPIFQGKDSRISIIGQQFIIILLNPHYVSLGKDISDITDNCFRECHDQIVVRSQIPYTPMRIYEHLHELDPSQAIDGHKDIFRRTIAVYSFSIYTGIDSSTQTGQHMEGMLAHSCTAEHFSKIMGKCLLFRIVSVDSSVRSNPHIAFGLYNISDDIVSDTVAILRRWFEYFELTTVVSVQSIPCTEPHEM